MGNITVSNAKMPVLVNWIVRYDDFFEMPVNVQGNCVGHKTRKNGSVMQTNEILVLDMKDKVLTLEDGEKYKLVGPGKRMLLIDEQNVLDYLSIEME